MVDYFAIAVTHFLLVIAAIRLLKRADLDREVAPGTAPHGLRSKPHPAAGESHPAATRHTQKRR